MSLWRHGGRRLTSVKIIINEFLAYVYLRDISCTGHLRNIPNVLKATHVQTRRARHRFLSETGPVAGADCGPRWHKLALIYSGKRTQIDNTARLEQLHSTNGGWVGGLRRNMRFSKTFISIRLGNKNKFRISLDFPKTCYWLWLATTMTFYKQTAMTEFAAHLNPAFFYGRVRKLAIWINQFIIGTFTEILLLFPLWIITSGSLLKKKLRLVEDIHLSEHSGKVRFTVGRRKRGRRGGIRHRHRKWRLNTNNYIAWWARYESML